MSEKVKPFVKWAGGKGSLISQLREFYPCELKNGVIKRYIEPFVGGGAVLIDILQKYNIEEVYAFDINKDLINSYNVIKNNVEELIISLKKLEIEYLKLEQKERKKYFYKKRNEYNSYTIQKNENSVKRVTDFIYLNRTCFNGLYRVNKDGKFNVPMGSYKNPTICDEENLRNLSKLIKNVQFQYGDYKKSMDYMTPNTFVYFDPPYRPLNITSGFTSYTKENFNDDNQRELAIYFKKLNDRNIKLMLSNSNPKNINKEDTFFDNIYKGFNIDEIYASRMINANSSGRGKISEILVTNYNINGGNLMVKDGIGGANTKTGLIFEGRTDLATFLNKQKGYRVEKDKVYYKEEMVARVFKKHQFYDFLKEYNIDWKEIISKKLLPDDCIFVIVNNTLFIIECKFQQVAGSVDEKLQTCDFKKKQYQKLLSRANIEVEYVYLLSDWFKKSQYKDVLDYIISVRCQYYFEYIPLKKLGLPVPEEEN